MYFWLGMSDIIPCLVDTAAILYISCWTSLAREISSNGASFQVCSGLMERREGYRRHGHRDIAEWTQHIWTGRCAMKCCATWRCQWNWREGFNKTMVRPVTQIEKSAIGAVGNGLGRYAKLCQMLVAYVLSAAPVLTTGYFRQST